MRRVSDGYEDESGDEEEDESGIDSDSGDDDEDENVAPNLQSTGRASRRDVVRTIPIASTSKTQRVDVEYAESDSDLRDEDMGRRFRMEDGDPLDIPSDEEDRMDEHEEEGEPGEEAAPKWKLNLAAKAQAAASSNPRRRKDWTKLIYSSELTPKEVLAGKEEPETAEDEEDDDGEFFRFKNVPRKDEEEEEDEDILDSIRGLFITGPVAADIVEDEGYEDVEGEGGDFEDLEVGDAAPPEAGRKFDEKYDDPETSKVDFYMEKKDEISRQLQLNIEEFKDVSAETRALVEGYRPGT
ncbi:hypothetical protein K438DRAFT_1988254 [Mycena galopus ATCC 62051]|nr:hypothetical protein K438DRAFT_1988254 [Mycena galopus ATCC 62051]